MADAVYSHVSSTSSKLSVSVSPPHEGRHEIIRRIGRRAVVVVHHDISEREVTGVGHRVRPRHRFTSGHRDVITGRDRIERPASPGSTRTPRSPCRSRSPRCRREVARRVVVGRRVDRHGPSGVGYSVITSPFSSSGRSPSARFAYWPKSAPLVTVTVQVTESVGDSTTGKDAPRCTASRRARLVVAEAGDLQVDVSGVGHHEGPRDGAAEGDARAGERVGVLAVGRLLDVDVDIHPVVVTRVVVVDIGDRITCVRDRRSGRSCRGRRDRRRDRRGTMAFRPRRPGSRTARRHRRSRSTVHVSVVADSEDRNDADLADARRR